MFHRNSIFKIYAKLTLNPKSILSPGPFTFIIETNSNLHRYFGERKDYLVCLSSKKECKSVLFPRITVPIVKEPVWFFYLRQLTVASKRSNDPIVYFSYTAIECIGNIDDTVGSIATSNGDLNFAVNSGPLRKPAVPSPATVDTMVADL